MRDKLVVGMLFFIVVAILALSILNLFSCKSTLEVPENLTNKCKYTWSLLIALHESGKNETTKSGVAMLLKDAQTACFNSIDNKRIREVSLKCREEVYKDSDIDLRDLTKKDQFESCVKLYEGEIK